MRFKITNHSKAPRGVHSTTGRLVFIQPGQTRTVDVANIFRDLRVPCLESVCVDEVPEVPADLAEAVAKFDRDGDGMPGGSLPHDPPALTGKKKADLLKIAKAEQVAANKTMTNAAIIEAIEAKRAGDA